MKSSNKTQAFTKNPWTRLVYYFSFLITVTLTQRKITHKSSSTILGYNVTKQCSQ
ncbi:hypothetical protein RchiOBHm_Chr2g0135721 [Rosa chinensis]|uniref:Uncharacterized protein n=1 Tax=Rosa chinensis TaxID=74649 RepID=A0A2P6RW59_ROSCH|nr:hypothetical protein RchiOBHm_Chr2g0135721 [Rosa chinensis]